MNSSAVDPTTNNENTNNNLIGLILALSSSFFIGASFVVNKMSLKNIQKANSENSQFLSERQNNSRDEEQILQDENYSNPEENITTETNNHQSQAVNFEFLSSPLWWLGTLTMALGEIANFSAYIYSPASLVTPLGALSVVVTCILSSYILKEKINLFSKLGIILAVLGSMFVVIHAPEQEVLAFDVFIDDFILANTAFQIFAVIQMILMVVLIILQDRHYIYRILLSSFSGSFCVIATKSTGLAVNQLFVYLKDDDGNGNGIEQIKTNLLQNYFVYLIILALISTISLQLIQITRALSLKSASTVMPIYYITFTMSVILAMNVLFREYQSMSYNQMASVLLGFGVLCCAVFMLHGFSHIPVYSFRGLRKFQC